METAKGGLGSTLPAPDLGFTATPVIQAGAAIAGVGSSATLETGSTDARGKIILVVGDNPDDGNMCSVNFGETVPGTAVVLIVPENGDAAHAFVHSEIFVSHEGGGGFDIDCNVAPDAGDTLWIYYFVSDGG